MLFAGRGVGIGQVDAVAGQHAGGVDIEARLRARSDGTALHGRVRQRRAHRGRELVELGLRLDQHLVAHFHIGRDLAGTDRAALQADRACRRSA